MKNYIFKTTATMKEYNNKKWWIDSDIVGEIRLTAPNVAEALKKYKEKVAEKFYIDISRNALVMLLQEKQSLRTGTITDGAHNILTCGLLF